MNETPDPKMQALYDLARQWYAKVIADNQVD